MELIWSWAYSIWHAMQNNDLTFRFVLWLRENGITFAVKRWLVRRRDVSLRKHPIDAMKQSRDFYAKNRERISGMLSMLSDAKSKLVWGGVMAYRMDRVPLEPELYSEDDQYFVRDIIRVEDGEVFVDGGAYVGDTIKAFLAAAEEAKAEFKKIIAFEPEDANFRMLRRMYEKNPRIELLEKGLSKQSGILLFRENGNVSRLTEDATLATTKVPVVAIDDLPESDEITWIKMDIEGAELDALEGARKTISCNHPKLTISIYHSNEDMVRIVEWVHALVPEYKLYVRHHSTSSNETVLYAVMTHTKAK